MLTLKRTYYDARDRYGARTEGVIVLPNGSEIKTLERPWKGNKPFVSCIPEGEYIVLRDHIGKHRYYAVQDVLDRSAIEIHPANTVNQLQGCIAPCLFLEKGVARHSTEACLKLIELFGEDGFHLLITS